PLTQLADNRIEVAGRGLVRVALARVARGPEQRVDEIERLLQRLRGVLGEERLLERSFQFVRHEPRELVEHLVATKQLTHLHAHPLHRPVPRAGEGAGGAEPPPEPRGGVGSGGPRRRRRTHRTCPSRTGAAARFLVRRRQRILRPPTTRRARLRTRRAPATGRAPTPARARRQSPARRRGRSRAAGLPRLPPSERARALRASAVTAPHP